MFCSSSPNCSMTPVASLIVAAPAATATVPMAAPTLFKTEPRPLNFFSESSAASAASSSSSPMSSASLEQSSSSRSMSFRAALALFSWICQFCVRRSFSPKDSEAFCRAFWSISIFCFWASIWEVRVFVLAARASAELSFLLNWDCTSFISEPRTLKDWLISLSAFLNSFSPSRPIFRPKVSATDYAPPSSDAIRDDLVNENLPFGFCNAVVLFMALPKIQE